MPEGVQPYPRWDGPLSSATTMPIIAGEEVRRAFNNFWSRLALMFIAAYSIVYLGSLYTDKQQLGEAAVHTKANFLEFLNNLRWGALALAAVMGGPGLLEDARRGALELYLSRAVTQREYIIGKILAVLVLSVLALFLPAVLYYLASFIFFDNQPSGWPLIIFPAFLHALIWGLLVSGLALGISCVARSSRGATLLLFGGFAVLEIVLAKLLTNITNEQGFRVLSPFAALEQQNEWLFGIKARYEFPTWWGLAIWAILVILGWALVAWRHPRVRGEERAGR